jgi:hypothetical protein
MGQKSNVSTLRTSHKNLSFLENDKESKKYLYGLKFMTLLQQFLNRKNILLTDRTLNFINNQCFLNLTLFFRSARLTIYKKKLKKKKKVSSKGKHLICSNTVTESFVSELSLIRSNFVSLNLNIINQKIDKRLLKYFYLKTKRFSGVLFPRRRNLFIDFVKMTSLFYEKKISTQAYLTVFGQIFKFLPKRTHGRFLLFFKILLVLLTTEINLTKKKVKSPCIMGIKFIVNGKLKGKPRSTSYNTQHGVVPTQSIDKSIDFAKLHVYTLYGVFGFRIWTH